jgi:hypothetical protein
VFEMDLDELRPGLYLVGSLVRVEPVRRSQRKGGEAIPGFWQLVIETVGGYQVRPTFNEYDRETGEPTPVWRAMEGIEAVGQPIVVRVAADVRQFRGSELVAVLDAIRNGAGVEALQGLIGKWINYRALSVVQLGKLAVSGA